MQMHQKIIDRALRVAEQCIVQDSYCSCGNDVRQIEYNFVETLALNLYTVISKPGREQEGKTQLRKEVYYPNSTCSNQSFQEITLCAGASSLEQVFKVRKRIL